MVLAKSTQEQCLPDFTPFLCVPHKNKKLGFYYAAQNGGNFIYPLVHSQPYSELKPGSINP